MGEATSIQWCDHTYNPWVGCPRVSPGCDHCYMHTIRRRWGHDPDLVTLSSNATFDAPRRWNRKAKKDGVRRRVFANSFSDFFGRESDAWRGRAWAMLKECDGLDFLILTKRHGRIAKHLPKDWGNGYPNVWLGVSAENQEWWDRRTAALEDIPAVVKWVSLEPMLGPVEPRGERWISWVVIGGESGSKRPFLLPWARDMVAWCRGMGTAVFVKQLGANPVECETPTGRLDGHMKYVQVPEGGVRKNRPLTCAFCRDLDLQDGHGGNWEEWPKDLRVREYPEVPRG